MWTALAAALKLWGKKVAVNAAVSTARTWKVWAAFGITILLVLLSISATFPVLLAGSVMQSISKDGACSDTRDGDALASYKTKPGDIPPVGGLSAKQVENAAVIIQVGKDLKIPERGWLVALITAKQESDLGADPTSTKPNGDGDAGVFQQRVKPGWYGSLENINNLVYSSTAFYKGVTAKKKGDWGSVGGGKGFGHIPGLLDIDGWETKAPTEAAQAVQRSAYPSAYAKHTRLAEELIQKLQGATVDVNNPASSINPLNCDDLAPSAGDGKYAKGWKKPGPWGGFSNGEIPADQMCPFSWQKEHRLRCDAQKAFEQVNAEFKKKFGHNISITDSYRPIEAQRAVAAAKPGLAAKPGTSFHGWALAVDLGSGIPQGKSSETYRWMEENAPKFGFINPEWAKTSKYEPWHWEFWGVKEHA